MIAPFLACHLGTHEVEPGGPDVHLGLFEAGSATGERRRLALLESERIRGDAWTPPG
jgi:hypothetical protein